MPTLSIFFGIVIHMYWSDHNPPHFHALYAEHEALIDIRNPSVLRGSLPKRALAMVLEWTQEHQEELLAAWDLASRGEPVGRIDPLQ